MSKPDVVEISYHKKKKKKKTWFWRIEVCGNWAPPFLPPLLNALWLWKILNILKPVALSVQSVIYSCWSELSLPLYGLTSYIWCSLSSTSLKQDRLSTNWQGKSHTSYFFWDASKYHYHAKFWFLASVSKFYWQLFLFHSGSCNIYPYLWLS